MKRSPLILFTLLPLCSFNPTSLQAYVTLTADVALKSYGTLDVDGDSTFDGPVLIEGAMIIDDGNAPWSNTPTGTYWDMLLPDGLFIWGSGSASLGLDYSSGDKVFFWYPYKVAFRSVVATDDNLDESNVWFHSIAMGRYAKTATGLLALGNSAYANNSDGIAIGTLSEAGASGLAIGIDVESAGGNSVVIGNESYASSGALVIGGELNAGGFSTVVGYQTDVKGNGVFNNSTYSTAVGTECFVTSKNATAIGYGLTVNSHGMTALGSYNVVPSGQSWYSWVTTDQLFVLGNGQSDVSRSNALVIYKNADAEFAGGVEIEGTLSVSAASGDVSMGAFGY